MTCEFQQTSFGWLTEFATSYRWLTRNSNLLPTTYFVVASHLEEIPFRLSHLYDIRKLCYVTWMRHQSSIAKSPGWLIALTLFHAHAHSMFGPSGIHLNSKHLQLVGWHILTYQSVMHVMWSIRTITLFRDNDNGVTTQWNDLDLF